MNNKENALKLIEEADWDTIRQIVGFLFDEQHLKGLVWNHIDMVIKRIEFNIDDKAEKELNDFLDMFDNERLGIKGLDNVIEIDEEKEMKADLKRKYD